MKFVIVAETGSDISPKLAEEYGIYLVPMHVSFGDETKDDGTFAPKDVCDYYERTGKLPKTSGCNPEDFLHIFARIDAEHPNCHIFYLAYSAITTCSYQSAKIAAQERENITFIDTKHVTVGQCASVIRFAQRLQEHPEWGVEEATAAAQQICQSVQMCFLPSNLDYLRAGGRVSNATALCGNILSIHPKIELVDGELKAVKNYRGKMNKVVVTLIKDFVQEKQLNKKEVWLGATHGFSEQDKQMTIQLAYDLGFQVVHWVDAGGVITTHGGYNAFCIAGYTKE